ncbi:MAG: hypothetical protein U0174_03605 [Polyangiaceae bacterium]
MRRHPELETRRRHRIRAGAFLVALCAGALGACGGSTSLGRMADGLGEGEVCPSERCDGQPQSAGPQECPAQTRATYTCRSDGRGACSRVPDCEAINAGALSDSGVPLGCPLDTSESAIVPPDVTKLTATSPGGALSVPPPAGSTCHPHLVRYVVDLDAKAIAWEGCDTVASNEPYAPSHGEGVLTDAQVLTIKRVFACLESVDSAPCTNDASLDVVQVTTPRGTTKYESALSCSASPPKIKGTSELFSSMRNVLL